MSSIYIQLFTCALVLLGRFALALPLWKEYIKFGDENGLPKFRPIYSESKTLIDGERDSESDDISTTSKRAGMATRSSKLKKKS